VTSEAAAPSPKSKLDNVKDEIRGLVSRDQLAVELSAALQGLFEITRYERFRSYNGWPKLLALRILRCTLSLRNI